MALIRFSSLTTSSSIALSCVEWDANVVWLRGDHDISTLPVVSKVLVRAIACDADLIFDLSEVSFMDAATVGVIVWTREHLRLRSRSLVLRSPSRCARRVIEVCGLSHLFDPEPIASYASEAADALRSWVAIAATDRVEHVERSAPEPPPTLRPVRASPVAGAVEASSAGARGVADERTSSPAGSGSP